MEEARRVDADGHPTPDATDAGPSRRTTNPDAIFKLPRTKGVHSFILMSILNDPAHVRGRTATQIITYSKLFSTYHSASVQ